jgi:hypothetical protein
MSAMPDFRMSCTTLLGLNKSGTLKPDSNGYYEVVLSALDYPNGVGAIYRASSAYKMLEQSSSLSRKIKDGQLYGEWGHPKPDGLSSEQYLSRMYQVYEERTSHHFKEVWIEANGLKDKNGRSYVGIMGLVKPAGELGHLLKDSFENNIENTAFSIRSITDNYMNRRTNTVEKEFVEIICWDKVNEPGLKPASKYSSPGLESFSLDLGDMPLSERLLKDILSDASRSVISLESNALFSIERMVKRIEKSKMTDVERVVKARPGWMNL